MTPTFDQLGRFASPARQILHVLASGPRVPGVILADVAARCGVEVGPGTLFSTIARLERLGLVEVVAAPAPPRAYRLTALGADTLAAQLAAVNRSAPRAARSTHGSAAT